MPLKNAWIMLARDSNGTTVWSLFESKKAMVCKKILWEQLGIRIDFTGKVKRVKL